MTKLKIKTKGMHCKSCEMLVEDALQEVDGIRKATASYYDNTVDVEFDESKVKKQDIINIIKKEGYELA